MNKIGLLPGVRLNSKNLNHHLWNNHGTWFLHYTDYPSSMTRKRIRRSLGTKDVAAARKRRDRFFEQFNTGTSIPPRKRTAA